MKGRRAAIDLDQIADTPLSEISAADFLEALGQGGTEAIALGGVWPEKKKLELWESEDLKPIKAGKVLQIIKVEKKKVELEIPDRVGPRVRWPDEFMAEIDRRIDARLGPG